MIGTRVANTLRYDPRLCINCGMCLAVCPHEVFAPDNHAVRLVNSAACMECGACQRNCPTGAVTVDSGVGCATAMIWAALTGGEVSCDGDSPLSCCGGSSGEDVTCGCSEPAAEASPAESQSACCGDSPIKDTSCSCSGQAAEAPPAASRSACCGGSGCCG